MSDTGDIYAEVKTHFAADETVVVNEGRGSQGIKYGKKMFVMFSKGDLLVQLPPSRVEEVVSAGLAELFDPGTGKPMKDRVLVPAKNRKSWIDFCEESKRYVQGK